MPVTAHATAEYDYQGDETTWLRARIRTLRTRLATANRTTRRLRRRLRRR